MEITDKNITLINYLKALAIIFVIIHHYNFTQAQFLNPVFPYVIYMAIPIFMIVTGFVYAKSYFRHNFYSLKNCYKLKLILKRVLRLTLPFIIIFGIEYYFNLRGLQERPNVWLEFLKGGSADYKGSYYYPVMLQIILIYPMLYLLCKKFNHKGFFIVIFIEIIYNLLFYYSGINYSVYRLQAFRYLTLLYSGIWFAHNLNFKIKYRYLLLSFLVGIFFIYIACYKDYPTIPYNYPYWKLTSGLFILMYIFPIFYLLYEKFHHVYAKNHITKFFEKIGQASWHIYLVQMVYYIGLEKYIIIPNMFIHIIINLIICIILGVLFYGCEKLLIKFLSRHLTFH